MTVLQSSLCLGAKENLCSYYQGNCSANSPIAMDMKVTQLCPTLRVQLYSPRNSPGQDTGMDSLSLLRGSSQLRDRTQVSHYGRILYYLSHKGSPRILEWVVYPFSSGSSRPRNRTGVSCIADRFFIN